MKIAITGGTGFVGRHLALELVRRGHEVVLIARGDDHRDESVRALAGGTFIEADVRAPDELRRAFVHCDAVAHCAGINREMGGQTYVNVHVGGSQHVVAAAKAAGVRKIVLLSFLRARPACRSGYHESKWAAEEIVRASGLDYTILKPGVIYGHGDHMLDHLSHALHTFPLFALVGLNPTLFRPLAVDDIVRIIAAALVEGRLSRQTVPVLGPEEMTLEAGVRRVASVVGKQPLFLRMPVWFHVLLALVAERVMAIPLVARAQVRILSESVIEPVLAPDPLPGDLAPQTMFTPEQIRKGLPPPGGFGWKDLRWT